VAIIYGLNSIPASPSDPLRNIDNVSFHNVNLSGSWGAEIFYTSNLDLSGLSVTAANGNAINLFGNTLVPPPALPGDYNGDGIVNAADYTIWRATLGSMTDLRANGDNTGGSAGVIDQADYDFWQSHFGNTSAGAGAASARSVPEPSSIILTAVALLCFGASRGARPIACPAVFFVPSLCRRRSR
jgi:hypothetical protein